MPDRIARSLVDLAMELHRRRLWTKSPPDAPFLVRVPDEEWPLVTILIGQAKSDYGVTILGGEHAFAGLIESFDGEPGGRRLADLGDILGVSFDPLGAIPAELRPILNEAGFSARREHVAPHVFVKKLGRRGRAPNRGEMRTLVWCLQGILGADDAEELRPQVPDFERKRVLEVRVTGEFGKPSIQTQMVPWPSASPAARLPGLLGLDQDLAGLPRLDERWIAALAPLPSAIQGDDRSVQAFVVADEETGLILASEIILADELEPVAAKLAEVFRGGGFTGRRGLPRQILFTSIRLSDTLSPALAGFGVRTEIGEEPTFLADLIDSLREELSGPGPRSLLPETIGDWKRIDKRVTDRLHEAAVKEELLTPRAMAQYFGSEEIGKRVLSELASLSPLDAFVEWVVSDYRPTQRSKTYVEKLLEKKGLDPAERVVLEARRSAELSVYRVDATEPGATLDVEDVLSGERRVVNDSTMSGCGLEGFFLTLRLMRVGEWTFPSCGGPPVSAAHVDAFLERLEELGVALTRGGLRRGADLVGRMWGWTLEGHKEAPKITNTDGEPLELQTAVFHVADTAALASALDDRDDVIADPDGTWTWLRAGGPAPGFGENTVLAHLELHDDSLVVEVNSAERLQRAREWLERVPDVRFERARTAEIEQRTLDDRLPSKSPQPLSRAMRDEVTRQFHQACRAWLDERVPALGNKTPRVASKTAAGRRRVARMIRSIPAMHAPGGSIAPPREELLRELGLEK